MKKLSRLDKIRLVLLLPMGLAVLFFGSILISLTSSSENNNTLPGVDNSARFLSTEVSDLLAQQQAPASPTPIPTTAKPTPTRSQTPTSPPASTSLSCSSKLSYSGSGQNLTYRLEVDTRTTNMSATTLRINFGQYFNNSVVQFVEYSPNCTLLSGGALSCNNLTSPAQVFFKVIDDTFRGDLTIQVDAEKLILNPYEIEQASCDASMTIEGVNTPPPGIPTSPGTPGSPGGGTDQAECNPMLDYCKEGKNLVIDGSFERPICSLNPDGSISGKECSATNPIDTPTYYQAKQDALIPINSQAFFVDSDEHMSPEYNRQEVVGEQQCTERLLAHGNNSFKIFSRDNKGIKGGLCLPMLEANGDMTAGVNFRVSQNSQKLGGVAKNIDVTFKLGYVTTPLKNDFIWDKPPSLSENSINWVDSELTTSADYKDDTTEGRYTGGFLTGNFPANARGLCFMAESDNAKGNVSINTFWDAAFAYTGAEVACENALDHSDGIDRSCGGYACGEAQLSGNFYTDFDQEYYAFDMPDHWTARQCHYETESNGVDSKYGALLVGLDLNSCDKNYRFVDQREINPDFDCANTRNWTYGYKWAGGIKDFGLLQYLDCAISRVSTDSEGNPTGFKGTEANQFFCDRILESYTNSNNQPGSSIDPNFWIRNTNTYSGLVVASQAENSRNFWKVPLLGSVVSTGVLNRWQAQEFFIDPFLLQKRNSGGGISNQEKFNLEDFVISQILMREDHQFQESTILKSEVLVTDLLAKSPVCTNIQGDPLNKIHYGIEGNESDRATFGFADDNGSFEHEIDESNEEIPPEEVCNLQFHNNRVVGAECTFFNIGDDPFNSGQDVTFTEDNINNSLEEEGLVVRIQPPIIPPVVPPPLDFDTCPGENYCGAHFDCSSTMRQLYDACVGSRQVDEIGGNPFIRWERPEGWRDLDIQGLNKVMEASWENEYRHYNHIVRHENVGIDVNQVVSVYDQQQPKCTSVPGAEYCEDDPAVNKAAQVCRRVEPYNCNCNPGNFATCLLECAHNFVAPVELSSEDNLPIEGGEDNSIRGILENDLRSPLEQFVALLDPRGDSEVGADEHTEGEVYSYEKLYTGGFLLANTGPGSQCTSGGGEKTGVSQVRIENYYAYAGQLPRMNERVGFAATNNADPDSFSGETIPNIQTSTDVLNAIRNITKGEAEDFIALPYCDLLTEEEKTDCNTKTDSSCDCLVRTCEQQYDAKVKLMQQYLPGICKRYIEVEEGNDSIEDQYGTVENCYRIISKHWEENIFTPAFETCQATPKSNLNFNCDPMANYLISQGFDTPELRLAACDEITNDEQCTYDKFGVHLITGPLQEANYSRAENLGLKWKLEVITSDSPESVDAMAQSINSFDGTSVFRFCNADQGDDGAKIPDQSCMFRAELPEIGSPEASGRKVAQFVMQVAGKTSKRFAVAPINEPISEHWYGGDPNDVNHPEQFDTTMPAVSEFYRAFVEELSTDQTIRSKIDIGGPTFNVTAFGNYENFKKMYEQFEPKDLVDYWTLNIYNNNDLPEDIQLIETQFAEVKNVIQSKPIAINESGDFQKILPRLKQSVSQIAGDSRLKYALLFNAFGGMSGDERAENLILTDSEIKTVLSGGIKCTTENSNLVCIEGGIYGLIKKVADGINAEQPSISAEAIYSIGIHEGFGNGLTGDPNEMVQTNPTLGNDADGDGQIATPCTKDYGGDKDAVLAQYGCEYDVRGAMQVMNFTFHHITTKYPALMQACIESIGVDLSNKGPIDEGILAMLGDDMNAYNQYPFSRNRVGDNICFAALFVADLGITETGSPVPPEDWEAAALAYTSEDGSNLIYRVAGRYLGVRDYDTCSYGSTKYQYCDQVALATKEVYERGTFDNISGDECADFIGYAGTCQEIFDQVKQEDAFSAVSNIIKYSEEVIPFFEDTFQSLAVGAHMCSMNHYGIDQTLYCFERSSDGSNVFGNYCLDCPIRATALFRHEINHAISPLGGMGRTLSEFSADAVSNNGGWYMFQYQNQWLFATQIVQQLAGKYGLTVSTINDYLNGKIANPGINFQSEVTGICHWSGSDAIGVAECPTKQVPPGLEQANCNNVGTPPSGTLPDPIQLGLTEGGNPINAYKFGYGPNVILFAGGVHGGYEWNSILLAYEAIQYFADNPEAVPFATTLYIIPAVNVDGQKNAGLGTVQFPSGNYPRRIENRYNDNGVDINRNFDCKWEPNPQGPGGSQLTGKGGTSVFSESESQILRDFILAQKPKATVFWHSVGGFVSPAGCGDTLYPPSVELSNTYGVYKVITDDNENPFAYEITGDITNWMETVGLSGTSVELSSTNNSEFTKNIEGMMRVLHKYGQSSNPPVPSGMPQPI